MNLHMSIAARTVRCLLNRPEDALGGPRHVVCWHPDDDQAGETPKNNDSNNSLHAMSELARTIRSQ